LAPLAVQVGGGAGHAHYHTQAGQEGAGWPLQSSAIFFKTYAMLWWVGNCMIIILVGTTAEMEVPCSPGLRRRRSRVPSEEDDKLINYLVAGGHDGSRERNLSIGGHIG
jgi:hypothetical protein